MDHQSDVVIIGAGQAGLCVSCLLKQSDIDHVVLERGQVGESWRSQRWDSFYLNTPNWANDLHGLPYYPESPDAFSSRDELIAYLEQYVTLFDLPVRPNMPVTALEKSKSQEYKIKTETDVFYARAVVVATGSMSRPRIPAMAEKLPAEIVNLSTGTYKNSNSLPKGAVVVIGTGQSGCQIAEELLDSQRQVYVCASKVARAPRAYRGREILDWWRDMGILDVRTKDLEDPAIQYATQPQVSGTKGGHTVSLQFLAHHGATLLGGALDIEGWNLKLKRNLKECIAFADEKAAFFKSTIDEYIERQGLQAPVAEPDPGEPDLPDLKGSDEWDTLNLKKANIRTVIWCTGFGADWSWIKIAAFDEHGFPRHRDGMTEYSGLYFTGFPWLSKRKSGLLHGVSEDAARIVKQIEKDLNIAA